jgi:hypothetical protein
MMRVNSLKADRKFLTSVAAAGRDASAEEVLFLLRDSWRPRVMGAWFALLHDDPRVPDAVLESLRSSLGSLTSPALAVAAVVLCGDGAVGALDEYLIHDLAHEWAGHGFVAAAIEHLGAVPSACKPEPRDRVEFEGLLGVAERLRQL